MWHHLLVCEITTYVALSIILPRNNKNTIFLRLHTYRNHHVLILQFIV